MIYIASPYAHPDPKMMEWRFEQAIKYTAFLYSQGIPAYSPIVHNHPIAIRHSLPRTWEFWKQIDLPMLRLCDSLHILCLDGWRKSVGVTAEFECFRDLPKRKEMRHIDPKDYSDYIFYDPARP